MSDLKKRILEISYHKKLSHIGSCLSCVDIIDEIYTIKKKDDIFLLSSAHASLAWYVILEKYLGLNAEKLFEKHGVHCRRDIKDGILCSGGHLGQVLTVATGFAYINRNRDIYCLISDGEWYEGCVQESLNFIKEYNLTNLKLYCNFNGWSACSETDVDFISDITLKYCPWAKIYKLDNNEYDKWPFLKKLSGHYHTITEKDWKQINA